MIDFTIRVLDVGDEECAQQLLALFDRAFEEDRTAPSFEYVQRLLQRADFHAVVALQNGQVIGGLTAYELPMFTQETCELFVYDVAVESANRRRGIGRVLIGRVRELCVARGLSAFFVGAMADEPDAVRFYEGCDLKREDVAWFSQEFEYSK